MKKLKNGMKVKIKKSNITYEWSDVVHNVYIKRETCIVVDAHIEKTSAYSSDEHWVCNLKTKTGELLSGFGAEELTRAFI